MIIPLAVATKGYLDGNTLAIATKGYIAAIITVITVPRSKGGRTRKIIDDRLPRLLNEDKEILELVMVITITGVLDD